MDEYFNEKLKFEVKYTTRFNIDEINAKIKECEEKIIKYKKSAIRNEKILIYEMKKGEWIKELQNIPKVLVDIIEEYMDPDIQIILIYEKSIMRINYDMHIQIKQKCGEYIIKHCWATGMFDTIIIRIENRFLGIDINDIEYFIDCIKQKQENNVIEWATSKNGNTQNNIFFINIKNREIVKNEMRTKLRRYDINTYHEIMGLLEKENKKGILIIYVIKLLQLTNKKIIGSIMISNQDQFKIEISYIKDIIKSINFHCS